MDLSFVTLRCNFLFYIVYIPADTPTSNTASHDNHKKINSWVFFSFLLSVGLSLYYYDRSIIFFPFSKILSGVSPDPCNIYPSIISKKKYYKHLYKLTACAICLNLAQFTLRGFESAILPFNPCNAFSASW